MTRSILVVTKEFGIPAKSGGLLRTLAIVRALGGLGEVTVVHPGGVDVLASGAGDITRVWTPSSYGATARVRSVAAYRTIGGARTCGPPLLKGLSHALARPRPFDAAVLDHTNLLRVRRLLPTALPVVASMHNVESDLMRQRIVAEPGVRKAAAVVERRLLHAQEQACDDLPTVVCTQADAERLARLGGASEAIVARNGVDPVTSSERGPGAADSLELLFTGALDWGPNISGVRWLVSSPAWAQLVARRPGLYLTVAGRRPRAEFARDMAAAPAVRLEADVPEMRPLLDRARLGVAPLLEGGGSRIKLLEYLVSGLPSVSTQVGASGLDNLPQGAVVQVEEDPQAFCAAIEAALDDGPAVLPPRW